jgi:hypothetical protein
MPAGFSLRFPAPGAVEGGWEHEGKVYRDRTLAYVVALPSITWGGKVGEAAEFAKAHYEQIHLFVRYLGLAEVL